MSHVTQHTARVTRHTSHVTRHSSHVTRHAGCSLAAVTWLAQQLEYVIPLHETDV